MRVVELTNNQSQKMDSRNRDIFLYCVVNVSVVGWSFYFAYRSGPKMFLTVLIVSLVVVNLVLFGSIKRRDRRTGGIGH